MKIRMQWRLVLKLIVLVITFEIERDREYSTEYATWTQLVILYFDISQNTKGQEDGMNRNCQSAAKCFSFLKKSTRDVFWFSCHCHPCSLRSRMRSRMRQQNMRSTGDARAGSDNHLTRRAISRQKLVATRRAMSCQGRILSNKIEICSWVTQPFADLFSISPIKEPQTAWGVQANKD